MSGKTYECIERFSLVEFDDDGFVTGSESTVEPGSVWTLCGGGWMIDGEIRLESPTGEWLEFGSDRLARSFKEAS